MYKFILLIKILKSNKSNMSFSLSLPPFLIASVSLLSPSPNRLHKLKTEFQKSNKVFIEKVFGFFQFKKPEFKETHPFFFPFPVKKDNHILLFKSKKFILFCYARSNVNARSIPRSQPLMRVLRRTKSSNSSDSDLASHSISFLVFCSL